MKIKFKNVVIHFIINFLFLFIIILIIQCSKSDKTVLTPVTPPAILDDAIPVIIDTDMGQDDWLAILYLLMNPKIDVKAITVTRSGEAHCITGTHHALDLIYLAGRSNIPVTCGINKPMKGDHRFPDRWRESADDMMRISVLSSPEQPCKETPVDLIKRIINESSENVYLLILGPATNIARAYDSDPSLFTKIGNITIMGGAIDVPGNIASSSDIDNKVAEWNIYIDPYAAQILLSIDGSITLVPLDASNHVPLTAKFFEHLKENRKTSVADFVYQVLKQDEESIYRGEYYFWDPLAAGVLSDETIAEFDKIPLSVIIQDGPQSGRTIRDDNGNSVRVALSADQNSFEKLFLDVLNGEISSLNK